VGDVDESLSPVLADPALLERVIANLVDNALQHGAGERTLGSGPDDELVEGERERLFEPFQQFDDTAGTGGVGLGLAVARGFVRAMGGDVTVEDTPGGGTTAEAATVSTDHFTVDLAAKRATTGAGEVRLTPTEWGLVETLVRNAGKLVSQKQLLQEVWGPQHGEETDYLRAHMAHIRRKLEPVPSHPPLLLTEPGMGYRFTGSTPS
jgi:DNA-binding winged helix-turn-helix (wHTH) protein